MLNILLTNRNKYQTTNTIRMKRILLIILIGLTPMLGFSQGCEEPSDEEGVTVFGFIQPQYDYIFDGDNTNQFNFNRARLGVMGSIPYDFQYYAVLEMSPLFESQSSPFLLDAFVSYNRYEFAKVALGQFKVPFSLELQNACHKLLTINRSKSVTELVTPMRDMGLMVFGGNDTTFVKYQFAVTNGTGINNMDLNSGKDIVGRVVLQPFDFVKVGGSYKYGTRPNPDETVTVEDTYLRWGLEAQVNFGNFHFQGEYIYAKDEGSSYVGGGCGGPGELVIGDFEKRGFYGMAAYMFDFGLQPVAKFEMYDKDINVTTEAEYISTFGINYFFNDYTRLQVNYCMIEESSVAQIDNNRLMVQMQIKF